MSTDKRYSGSGVPMTGVSLHKIQGRYEVIPDGAVPISKQEVLKMKMRVIDKWHPKTDVWPFTYGLGGLGAVAATSGAYLNSFLRRKFNLKHQARISSALPVLVLPSLAAMAGHYVFVSSPLILQEPICPLCADTRSAAIQAVTGFLHPLLMSVLCTGYLAKTYQSYPLPSVIKAPREVYNIFMEKLRPIRGVTLAILTLNLLAGVVITQAEAYAMIKIDAKLRDGF